MSLPVTDIEMPDSEGHFGEYGGRYVPPQLASALEEITVAYNTLKVDESFKKELYALYKNYAGRPSPLSLL